MKGENRELTFQEVHSRELTTFKDYALLTPFQQGYIIYLESDWPGSELKHHKENPYFKDSKFYKEFEQGSFQAMLHAQDSED